ncbi:hypothetical protein Tco_1549597 [Tanacetum coccineum]
MSALRHFGNENNKYGEFNTLILKNPKLYAGNPVKKIHTRMVIPYSSRIEVIATCSYLTKIVLKLKNFKKDDYTSFQDQETYEHVGPKVTSSHEGKRSHDDDKRLDLADDLKEAQDHIQVKLKEQAQA